ncbi:hypothetical protein D3C81_173630 [compost metagenome]
MSEFTGWGRTNEIDFGDYVKYPHGMSHEPHMYKVVGSFQSNVWRDIPDWFQAEETSHSTVEKVLNIIHCGIDETKVLRVRESDCIKIRPKAIESSENTQAQAGGRIGGSHE